MIDNADHLIPQTSRLIEQLGITDGLTILLTSQHPLRIADEQRLEPLPTAAAVELFCQCTGSEPTEAVRAICRALHGLPLAIELTAGLTRVLTIEQLADQLPRDADPRHTGLTAIIDWSHDLLPPDAQTVLRRVAVFSDGFSLEAAEQVVTGTGVEPDLLPDLLAELVHRSLLTIDENERFGLPGSVRSYGLAPLRAAGEEPAIRRRQVAWCVELAGFAEQYKLFANRFGGIGRRELSRRLRIEEPNLLAALDWCLTDDESLAQVARIVTPLTRHWYHRGLIRRARDWLRHSLDGLPPDSLDRAAALRSLAAQTRYGGDYAEALTIGLESLDLHRRLADDHGTAIALQSLALTTLALDRPYETLGYTYESEQLTRRLGFEVMLGASLNCTGIALRQLGYRAAAGRCFTEARQLWAGLDDTEGVVIATGNLAITGFVDDDLTVARQHARYCLRAARDTAYATAIADSPGQLAVLEGAAGRHDQAIRLLAVARRHREEIGAPLYIHDELAMQQRAWSAATTALGSEADRIAETAGYLSVDTLVDELLAEDRS